MFCTGSDGRQAQREATDDLPAGGCDDTVSGCTRARLIVIVSTSDGTPLPGARVQIDELGVDGSTDALGRYDTGHVAPGHFTVRVSKPLHFTPASADTAHGSESVAAGEDRELPLVLDPLELHLHVDADRDGTVDDDRSGLDAWDWGAGRKGAIVLCNSDGDGSAAASDNSDNRINAGNDASEVAPLELRRRGPTPPADMTAVLRVDNPAVVRVFNGRGAGATEVIGPAAGGHWNLPGLSFGTLALGIEALRHAGVGFGGEVRLSFEVSRAGALLYTEHARLRVAPWMMPNHLDRAEKVFVADSPISYPPGDPRFRPGGGDNAVFRAELARGVAAAGCTLAPAHASPDRWMQDCMEFGYTSLPGAGFRAVSAAFRKRPLQSYPTTLRRADMGYLEPVALSDPRVDTTYDSTGNLECSPPVTLTSGKRYPYGRILVGGVADAAGEQLNPDTLAFLQAQVVQEPIVIDTTWLEVGHVDEFISFVPGGGSQGFKVLLPSPARAYAILDAMPSAQKRSTHMLVGRKFKRAGVWTDVEVTVRDFLNAGLPMLGMDHVALRSFNTATQAHIQTTRTQLMGALGLVPADVIDVPVLFLDESGLAGALTGDMVNMLVINGHCLPPKAFGPMVGGTDVFERELQRALRALGLTLRPLDDWYEYHVAKGEVHCGTNTLRQPVAARWWEFAP